MPLRMFAEPVHYAAAINRARSKAIVAAAPTLFDAIPTEYAGMRPQSPLRGLVDAAAARVTY